VRIIVVWITAIILLFTISVSWWATLPAIMGVGYALNDSITHPTGRSVATGVQYAGIAWGPLLCIFILLWAIISSQKRDIESEYMYG